MPPPRRKPPLSPEHAALGEAIRVMRLERGLKQEGLADLAGTDHRQVGFIERGQRNPSYTTLLRLAKALETSPGKIATLADRLVEAGWEDRSAAKF
jgi:XRE family transcriptional regulator, regulator of sulfur utilization